MTRELKAPITCLITSGATGSATTERDDAFQDLLALVSLAVSARITLVQLREKSLNARTLYSLASRASDITRGSATHVIVNDRADIARAALCDGVQLTTRSLDAPVVRRAFGTNFLIGVSAHNIAEARAARDGGANFAVFGPVFDTPSKRAYGPPLGLEALREAARTLAPFPLVAIGGIAEDNLGEVFGAGASGVAAIRMFANGQNLARTVHLIESLSAR